MKAPARVDVDAFQQLIGAFTLSVPRFSVEPGDVTVIVGANGSGKTTLLKLLAGLLPVPAALRVHGRPVTLVHQQPYLFRGTVERNVMLGPSTQGLPRADREARGREALRLVDAGSLISRSTRDLSGGEAQRVAFARALAVRPSLFLIDEPLATLDASGVDMFRRLLERRSDLGATIIWSTPIEPRPELPGQRVYLTGAGPNLA